MRRTGYVERRRPSAPNLRRPGPSRVTRRRQRVAYLSAGASFVDRAPAAAIAGGSPDGTRETIMTKQTCFKRCVRARMAKTGESYATARSRLLAGQLGTTPDDSPLDWMPEALHISNGDATDVPGTGLTRRVTSCTRGRCPRSRRPSCAGPGSAASPATGAPR